MVSWKLRLDPGARSVQAGRSLVRRVLDGLDDERVETAALLTDELVANAVVHGRPPLVLAISRDENEVNVTVTDSGPGTPRLCAPAHAAEHGRGLVIVDVLADHWGVDELPGRKRVWFQMETGGGSRGPGPRSGAATATRWAPDLP